MNWIFKNKNKRTKAIVVALFLVSVFLFKFPDFWESKTVLAATECVLSSQCKDPAFPKCDLVKGFCTTAEAANISATTPAAADVSGTPPIVEKGEDNIFFKAIKLLLIGILNMVGWLFAIAATLFSWAIEPANISGPNGLLNKPAVKDVWIMVRDLLNMTFILVLLFAAFCTIFQYDKYNLKKVWLNILINALLVNFSYPIARFFIDVSNVAFYYFVNHLFSSTGTVTGSGIFAMFGASSGIGELLSPNAYASYSVSYLVAMIIIAFIMGMTILIVAALFVVRLIALTMLVMFSPVGFVGYIFPSTAKHADEWWSQLFSYSFFAPIMIFIMAVALKITEALGKENMQSFKTNAISNTGADQANWIAQAAFLVIPIIILWMGIGMAKKSGGALASEIVDRVKKGGKWLANSPGKYSGIYGGTKKGWDDMRKTGSFLGMNNVAARLAFKSGVADREAKIGGFVSGGADGYRDAKRDLARKGANDIRESWKKAGGASSSELEHALNGSQAERMAAALEMSEKNGFKLNDTDTAAQVLARYQNAAKALTGDKVLQNNFNDKVKEKHIKLVIQDEIGTSTDPAVIADIYKKHLDKLNSSKFSGQKGLADSREAAEYLGNRQATGNRTDLKFVANVLGGMTTEDRAKLHSHAGTGLHV